MHRALLILLLSVTVLVSCEARSTSTSDGGKGRGAFVVASAIGGVKGGEDVARQLTDLGLNVHGVFEDIVVASSSSPLYMKLARAMRDFSIEVHYKGDLSLSTEQEGRYVVLERADRAFVTYSSPIKTPEGFTVLYSSHKRIVAYTPSTDITETFEAVAEAEDLEIIPIDLSTPIHLGIRKELEPIVSAVYANASLKYTTAPNPVISKLVDQVSPKTLRDLVKYLSGEDPTSNILTRNARSQGAKDAQEWLEDRFNEYGLTVTTQAFQTGYSSNVIGIKLGATDPSKVVVIGAHYDSRGPDISSTTQRAPGANDNGSGTGAVLHIAKIFNDSAAKFDYTIHFIVYSGEEQGLYGSAAYATKLINDRVSVIGVLNADMIAFHVPGEPTQCAFPSRYSTPNLEVLAREATYTYVPELTIGVTTACCSDHQSYYNKGLPATGFFERNGAIADNQYHKSADLVERSGYDVDEQYTQLTKAVLATLAVVAGAIKI